MPLLPGFGLGRWWSGLDGVIWEPEQVVWGLVVCSGIFCLGCGWFSLRERAWLHGGWGNVCFGVALFFFLFFFGIWRSSVAWQDTRMAWPEEPRVWRVMLAEVPEATSRAVSVAGVVLDAGSTPCREAGRIRLSFYGDGSAAGLQVGDEVVFRGVVRSPVSRGNPEEFDYPTYLAVKGISGVAGVGEGDWKRVGGREGWDGRLGLMSNLRIGALSVRDRLLRLYRDAGLEGEPMELMATLTLGEDSGLQPGLQEVYAEVGVMHVLALSGTHLTYLVAMLHFLLLRYCRGRAWEWGGGLLVLALAWGYTFLAGLPPSLVRAAVTYSCMSVGGLLGRSGFSLNALAVSAVLMLCVNPLWLYDVGFQLSFLAMAGILVVYPKCRGVVALFGRHWAWLPESLLVSLAASAFTVPLVACCFGTFAPYSALGTLLVSPISAVLVCAMPVLWLAGWTGVGAAFCVGVVEFLVSLQNGCLRWMAGWPCATVDADWSPLLMVSCYAGLALCFSRRWFSRAVWLKLLLGVALWMVCMEVVAVWRRRNSSGVVFYNNPACPAVHVIYSSSCSYLFPVDSTRVPGGMAYIADTFWRRKLDARPLVVAGRFADSRVSARDGLVACRGGLSFLLLSDARWENVESATLAEVDYIYVCRGFTGGLSSLSRLFRPRGVVLDASLWPSDRARYREECLSLGWACHDMRSRGALKLGL